LIVWIVRESELMKTVKLIGLLFVAAAACLFLGGCAAFDAVEAKVLSRRDVVVTNYVDVQKVLLASDGVLSTNLAREAVVSTNAVYGPNPDVIAWLKAAQQVNSMANPTPSAPPINWALQGLTLALYGWAELRNKRKSAVMRALVTGVQSAVGGGASPVKAAIDGAAKALGVSDALHSQVVRYTKVKV
jgi:hypothetical protein